MPMKLVGRGVYQRGPHTYIVKVERPRDPLTGKRRPIWKTVKGGKRDAERLRAKLITEVSAGLHAGPRKMTVGEVATWWLDNYVKKSELAARTAEVYEDVVRDRIIPALGSISVEKLQPYQLHQFYRELRERGRKGVESIKGVLTFAPQPGRIVALREVLTPLRPRDRITIAGTQHNDGQFTVLDLTPKRTEAFIKPEPRPEGPIAATIIPPGLSGRTVLHIHVLLKQIFGLAVRYQIVDRNPVDRVDAPKVKNDEMKTANADEALEIIDLVEGTQLHIPVQVAIYAGLRLGEVLALRWSDIDFDGALINVRHTLERAQPGRRPQLKEPKTRKGNRVVSAPSLLMEALRRHKAEQEEQRRYVSDYQDNDAVVCQRNGAWLHGAAVSSLFIRYMRKAGKRIRFHDLRHSHVTLLIESKVHAKVASERAGHSNIATTMDLYGHVMRETDENVAVKVDQLFRAAIERRAGSSDRLTSGVASSAPEPKSNPRKAVK